MFSRASASLTLFASTSRTHARTVAAPAVAAIRALPRDARQQYHQASFTSSNDASPSAEAQQPTEPPTHYRITLLRSALGLPSYARDTLRALGLKKRMQQVYHPFGETAAGQILRVKELVRVENVPTSQVVTKEEARAVRRSSKGFEVIGKKSLPWTLRDEFREAETGAAKQKGAERQGAPAEEAIINATLSSLSVVTTHPLHPLGVRTFYTSRVVCSQTPVAPVLPQPLTHESTPSALNYLDNLTADLIPRSSVHVEFSRSSGPGGQNVNKLNTKATLRMNMKPLPKWVPTWCEDGLRSSKEYAPSSNSIVIQSSSTRSQASNVEDCFRKLHALVDRHARSVLVPVPDEDKKKRVSDLVKRDAARRRVMKDKQKAKKANRRGDGW